MMIFILRHHIAVIRQHFKVLMSYHTDFLLTDYYMNSKTEVDLEERDVVVKVGFW